ncbi:hypothetical protein R6Q59_031346 [Mikania micrantha]
MKMAGSMYELGSYLPSSFTTTCHDSIACIPTPSHHGSGLGRGTVKRSGEGLADQEARWEVDLSPVGDTIVEAEVWPETQQRVPVVRQVAHGGAWSLQEMNGGIAGGTRAGGSGFVGGVIDKQMEEVKEIAKDMGEVIDVIENLP